MKKKKLLIITTGGTLACVQDDKGLLPGLSGKEILSHISHITGLYEVDFLELFQLDSANIQPAQHALSQPLTGPCQLLYRG